MTTPPCGLAATPLQKRSHSEARKRLLDQAPRGYAISDLTGLSAACQPPRRIEWARTRQWPEPIGRYPQT